MQLRNINLKITKYTYSTLDYH